MEIHPVAPASEIVDVHLFGVERAQQREGSVGALLLDRHGRHFLRVGDRQQLVVEGAGQMSEIEHAGLHRVAHLERVHRLEARGHHLDLQSVGRAGLVGALYPCPDMRIPDAVHRRQKGTRFQRDGVGGGGRTRQLRAEYDGAGNSKTRFCEHRFVPFATRPDGAMPSSPSRKGFMFRPAADPPPNLNRGLRPDPWRLDAARVCS